MNDGQKSLEKEYGMKKFSLELYVGIFIVAGILCLTYLSVKLGKLDLMGNKGTVVFAVFSNIGGLKNGAEVQIAGVNIGRVKEITLEEYQAKVKLQIDSGIQLQEDVIASIKTKGLVGEKYIEISPGGADNFIPGGGKINDTLPPFDLEKAISRIIFGKVSD
jgi:phospholipid/cholesterol/gamma-HCH transport system substrate-binding protein